MWGAMVWQMQAMCGFVFSGRSARGATVASYRLGHMFRPRCSAKGLGRARTMTIRGRHKV
jgi:hypothetical protein